MPIHPKLISKTAPKSRPKQPTIVPSHPKLISKTAPKSRPNQPTQATKLTTKPKVKSTTQSTTTIATNDKESKTDSVISITIFFDPFDQPRHMIHVLHPKEEGLQLHLFAPQFS